MGKGRVDSAIAEALPGLDAATNDICTFIPEDIRESWRPRIAAAVLAGHHITAQTLISRGVASPKAARSSADAFARVRTALAALDSEKGGE